MALRPAGRQVQVLYIVYWGAIEPLGQALVLPSVTRLAGLGAGITLVTFDKQADLADAEQTESVRESLRDAGVRWLSLRYHKRPKLPATAFDLSHGVARGIVERIRERPDVIHARTFAGGLIGLPLARLTGANLVYHNEGFYPDEQVDAGFWQAGSLPHRVARSLEGRLYSRSDAVFSISNTGKEIIESLEGVQANNTPVIVVPSCVDLEHFSRRKGDRQGGSSLKLVYVGSVGGRYLVDRIGRFAQVARLERPDTHLQILTPADPDLLRATLDPNEVSEDVWSSRFVPYSQLPAELSHHDAGLCFYSHSLSAPGGSSTKVGEYWAMGLPVISTPGLGDVDHIIRRERVGVVVRDHTDNAYREALERLLELRNDPDLADRCRRAAERHYSLDVACERQIKIYRQLATG